MSDDVRRWSEELARDPSSTVFLQLGEALRRQGQPDIALKVAVRGLERHPHLADAHDLLARIAVDRGELDRAFDEWDVVLRLAPGHAGARKGMGFVCYRQGRMEEADRYLSEAAGAAPDDQSIAAALAHVRQSLRGPRRVSAPVAQHDDDPAPPPRGGGPGSPGEPVPLPPATASAPPLDARLLFLDVIGDGHQTALLLDADGLVLAGTYVAADGLDIAQEVGAQLSGVSDEAQRAMRHLDLGDWSSIIFETDAATVALAPAPGAAGGLVVVAAARETPLGFVRRLLDRVAATAGRWLGGTP